MRDVFLITQVNYGIAAGASQADQMYSAIDQELASNFQLHLPRRVPVPAGSIDSAPVTRRLDHAVQIAPLQQPLDPSLLVDEKKDESHAAAIAAAQFAEEEALKYVCAMQHAVAY